MKFTKEAMLCIEEDCDYEGDGYTLRIEDSTDWISEGKYEYKEIYFEYDGKYYRLGSSRSGSYFTDYTYDSDYWNDEIAKEHGNIHHCYDYQNK